MITLDIIPLIHDAIQGICVALAVLLFAKLGWFPMLAIRFKDNYED